MAKKYFKNRFIIFAILFAFAFIFYFDSFKHFFYQDDIWHFYISKISSLKEFFEFFNPINKFGYQVYRPLSTQVFFFLFQNIFGLNHAIFQFIVILLLGINSFLIYEILKKYTTTIFAFLLSIFYISHHQNIGIVYYLSTIQLSFAVLFTLLSIKQLQEKKNNWQIKILIFYILSIFCQEISLLNSIIFIGILLVEDLKNLKIEKKLILALLFATISYLIFRFYFINQQIFTNDNYHISLNPKTIINNLFWYGLWMASIPEYLINFVGSGFKPLPPLFGQYRLESTLSLLILLINLSVFTVLLSKVKNKKLLIYPLAFVLSLAPVLVFPWHKYVYHLPIASIFILIFCGKIIGRPKKSIVYLILIAALIFSSIISNFIDRRTSYNYKRGVTAQNFKENIDWKILKSGQKNILVLNDPTFTVFSKDWGSTSSQAKIVLKENLFFTILSNNYGLQVFYEDDLESLENVKYDYEIVAKKEW
jgi:hypothetical protein